jgi:hypothetical protein
MGPIHQLSESAEDSGYQCKMGMDYWLVRINDILSIEKTGGS